MADCLDYLVRGLDDVLCYRPCGDNRRDVALTETTDRFDCRGGASHRWLDNDSLDPA